MTDKGFYITFHSNKSTEFYPDNNPAYFTAQLPRTINLEGVWVVGLCEISFPIGFLHINPGEGRIILNGSVSSNTTTSIPHGVYQNTEAVISTLNEDKILNQHFEFIFNVQTRFTTIKKICKQLSCPFHTITFTEKLSNILGFKYTKTGMLFSKNIVVLTSKQPSSLLRALPSLLYIYTDICSPYIIGDKSKQLLRVVSFNGNEYKYGCNYNINFQPYYLPVVQQSFQTISFIIKDDNDQLVLFGDGPLLLTVHFQKIDI